MSWNKQQPQGAHRVFLRRGFTVVELLVVIAVIGILIAILVPAVQAVRTSAANHAITTDMQQIEQALHTFKSEHNIEVNPPDFALINPSDPSADDADRKQKFVRFLRLIKPQHTQTQQQIDDWWGEVGTHLRPDSALVFWLSGVRKSEQYPLTLPNGTRVPAFSPNEDPNAPTEDYEFPMEFKSDRFNIVGGTNNKVATYLQNSSSSSRRPYIYFKATRPAYNRIIPPATSGPIKSHAFATGEIVRPYNKTTAPSEFYAESDYQIIAAGIDGKFSPIPSAGNWFDQSQLKEHRNNITSFSEGILDKEINQ